MKKLIFIFFLLVTTVYADPPTRQYTYTSGTTIRSSEVTANENALFTYLQNGVDTYKDNTILNADVNASAAIESSKLDLSGVSQDVTMSGTFTTGSLVGTADLDIGSHDLRASTLTADSLTATRVPFASTNGKLVDDSDMTFATDTLTVTKLSITNTITEFSTDGTLGGDSDSAVPTEKAVKTYVDTTVTGKAFRAYASEQLNIGASGYTVLFATESFDAGGKFASNTYTPASAGYYQINSSVQLAGCNPATNNSVTINILKNNSVYVASIPFVCDTIVDQQCNLSVTDVVYDDGNDFFNIYLTGQDANCDVSAGTTISFFSGARVF